MTRSLLLKNADVALTMDDTRREIVGGCVRIAGNRITDVGVAAEMPPADEEIDLQGHVLMPGLVNTHHHMFQCLTRATPGGQNAELFGWLKAHYPIWARITPEMFHVAAKTAMAELILSGCTTSSDHQYLYVNGATLEQAIEAASDLGLRFHAARGAMSVGESAGGLAPDALMEKEPAVLKEMQRLVERWHDPLPGAMLRIVLAPCSPFTVSDDLMIAARDMARAYGVSLHTHLAESDNDVSYSIERYGKTPTQYVEDLEWVGRDVWHAHCVKLDAAARAPAWRIVRARTCGWHRASRRSGACGRSACPSGSGWTVRPRRTRATCWARRGKPCSPPAWAGTLPR
jgi:8-oxoguanine deaminase